MPNIRRCWKHRQWFIAALLDDWWLMAFPSNRGDVLHHLIYINHFIKFSQPTILISLQCCPAAILKLWQPLIDFFLAFSPPVKGHKAPEAGTSVCPCYYPWLTFMLPLIIGPKALFGLVWSIQWRIQNTACPANRTLRMVPTLRRHWGFKSDVGSTAFACICRDNCWINFLFLHRSW